MLEFWLDPNSSYYQEHKIKEVKKMVLYCTLGLDLHLATKTFKEMGFKNVANAKGGFDVFEKYRIKNCSKTKNNLFTASFKANSILS